MKHYDGFTKKQIINYFNEKFINMRLNKKQPCIRENFIASDTKELIKLSRLRWSCRIRIKNDNFQYEKVYYDDGEVFKTYHKKNKFHSIVGPAIISKNDGKLFYRYYINGKFYTREKYKKFIRDTLNTTSFNRLRKIDKLEAMQEIYIHYNRTEQLKTIKERIKVLKIVKELENGKGI